jgi:hypothetical protein
MQITNGAGCPSRLWDPGYCAACGGAKDAPEQPVKDVIGLSHLDTQEGKGSSPAYLHLHFSLETKLSAKILWKRKYF